MAQLVGFGLLMTELAISYEPTRALLPGHNGFDEISYGHLGLKFEGVVTSVVAAQSLYNLFHEGRHRRWALVPVDMLTTIVEPGPRELPPGGFGG